MGMLSTLNPAGSSVMNLRKFAQTTPKKALEYVDEHPKLFKALATAASFVSPHARAAGLVLGAAQKINDVVEKADLRRAHKAWGESEQEGVPMVDRVEHFKKAATQKQQHMKIA